MICELPHVSVNPHWLGYQCSVCEREHAVDWTSFVCADCGAEGILDVRYDYAAIRADLDPAAPFPQAEPANLWRFAALLPLQTDAPHPAWSCGGTPLQAPERLREKLGFPQLTLKDDTGLPSASLKDRASAVAIADASRRGLEHIACASTGNAAASLAVLAARAGIACTIFVPATAPAAKLAQLVLHGAKLVRVDGDYDQTYDLSLRALEKHSWYSRNCAHNPLLVEGKKTAALEIAAALSWQVPDAVFVPVGDGCIVASVGKAFAELKELGLCQRVPRIFGVQSEGAAPLALAWQKAGQRAGDYKGREILQAIRPCQVRTLADSIAVGTPRNRVKAWQRVAASGGGFLSVPDTAIIESVGLLARLAGVFAEPSGAAALAGLLAARERGLVGAAEQVTVMITGHGLKDPTAALAGLSLPDPVAPTGPLPL